MTRQRVWTRAIAGFATLVLLSTGAMVFIVQRLNAVSSAQIRHIQATEKRRSGITWPRKLPRPTIWAS